MTGDASVTLRTLSLGSHASRDSWSGWRTKTYTPSTIDMVIQKKGAIRLSLLAGIYPSLDAVGRTADAVSIGDQILDGDGNYWDVETVVDHKLLDGFIYRDCHMNHAKMYQADFGTATWTKTRPQDARYNMKAWMIGSAPLHLRDSQITKDDDSTEAEYGIMFNNPPYPLSLEFRHVTTPVQGLYVVDQPNSTPLRDGDQTIRDYEDHVPIHVMAVDSTSCRGDGLAHKMAAELQYICETYPQGSQRNLDVRRTNKIDLGGMWMYDMEYTLTYVRTAST